MSYNVNSEIAEEFISRDEILDTISYAGKLAAVPSEVEAVIRLAEEGRGLSHRQAAILMLCDSTEVWDRVFALASQIKHRIYGRRIVLFAPLYLSNYCVNSCVYCPYHSVNRHIPRRRLSQDEIRREVTALQDMGHKRIAVESGEHPLYSPLEYILESLETIYSVRHRNGAIRRANVNIAATSVDDYRRLHDAKIGTYILFQETYDKAEYERLHPAGPKSDYAWHTEAMDRAMLGGIEDVGIGALLGLGSYRYEMVALLMHAEHLEARFGVGPHTVSVPRICPADDISKEDFPDALSDTLFERMVALLRISLPYTGIIISTRESQRVRARVLELGVSQISGGSRTSVGGYVAENEETAQFDISDRRSLAEVVDWLITTRHIPSFCTACYRRGRVGHAFMEEAKSGHIGEFCTPNALLTLREYLADYASPETQIKGERLLAEMLPSLAASPLAPELSARLDAIARGNRDLYF